MLCFHEGTPDGALCVHPGAHLPRRTADGHLAYGASEARDIVEAATGERPLLLEELLGELADRDMEAMLESKVAGTVARLLPLLARSASRLTVLSFLGEELTQARDLRRGCLIKHDPTPLVWQALQQAYGSLVYAPEHWYVSQRTMEHAHALGVKVVPWDVDDPAHALRLARMGADAVISNEPEGLLERGACEIG
jgi:glycerophosphoryl diester phosphodiesterase